MIGGQYRDVTGDTADLAALHRLKTGALFSAAVGCALWVAEVPEASRRPGARSATSSGRSSRSSTTSSTATATRRTGRARRAARRTRRPSGRARARGDPRGHGRPPRARRRPRGAHVLMAKHHNDTISLQLTCAVGRSSPLRRPDAVNLRQTRSLQLVPNRGGSEPRAGHEFRRPSRSVVARRRTVGIVASSPTGGSPIFDQ